MFRNRFWLLGAVLGLSHTHADRAGLGVGI